MDKIKQAEHQVTEAEKHYFSQLDLVAELLGHPHPRDPRHSTVEKEIPEEKTAA